LRNPKSAESTISTVMMVKISIVKDIKIGQQRRLGLRVIVLDLIARVQAWGIYLMVSGQQYEIAKELFLKLISSIQCRCIIRCPESHL
jgi:hypothetical protein